MRPEALLTRSLPVLAFLKAYHRLHHRPPTKREIMRGVGLSSVSVVHYRLETLRDAGLITLASKGETRGAVPVEPPLPPCPLCGCGVQHG